MLTLKDISPLPIFAYVPSLLVWCGVGALLLILAWLVGRSQQRARFTPPSAIDEVEGKIVRCVERGGTREDVFLISRSIKVLLRASGHGDFTAATPEELSRAAEGTPSPSMNQVLRHLAQLDRFKYRPEGGAPIEALRELRSLLRPILMPPPTGERSP